MTRLQDARDTTVMVQTPAGYGKTTLLTQLANEDARPVGWLSLSRRDNDPAFLLEHVAWALNSLEPVDAGIMATLTMSGADVVSVLLPRLCGVLESRSQPFVLVLDDVDALTGAVPVEVLRAVADSVPRRSQLVLASRSESPLPHARLEADGRLLHLNAGDLEMTTAEGAALLRALGVEVGRELEEVLVAGTEGWPAGLALAALAIRHQPQQAEAAEHFAGDDRAVGDYFREEVLRGLPEEQRRFLVRSSVLDRLSGPACDAILHESHSAQWLESLARSSLFVVPLDRHGEWYRYHRLFRDMLRSELHHVEPELENVLCGRASEWHAAHGDPSRAIEYARAAGDLTRAAARVWSSAPNSLASGGAATVSEWLESFEPDEIAAEPALAITMAWWCIVSGDTAAIEPWAALAERSGATQLPDGTPLRSALALLRALVGKEGLSRVREDAALAFELERAASPYRPMACYLEGAAARLLGSGDAARARLEEGVRLGALQPSVQAHCLSQLALLAIQNDAWAEAESLIRRSLRLIDEHLREERPAMAGVYAVAASCHARAGATDQARSTLKHGLWLLEMVSGVGPWFVVETGLLLARTSLFVGDVAKARMLVKDAERVLAKYPDAGVLPERLEEARRLTRATAVPVGVAASPLTPAEMRVLRYLPTHLSFEAIAGELFVSRNTIKTQAIAIYRKLGVSSRALAVQQARELGLLEE